MAAALLMLSIARSRTVLLPQSQPLPFNFCGCARLESSDRIYAPFRVCWRMFSAVSRRRKQSSRTILHSDIQFYFAQFISMQRIQLLGNLLDEAGAGDEEDGVPDE
jgi:hypothetical protein